MRTLRAAARRRGRSGALVAIAVVIAAAGASIVGVALFRGSPASAERFAMDGRPSAVAVVDGLVWISEDSGHSVRPFDVRTGEPAGRAIRVGRNPIAMAPDAGALWVAHADGTVVRIDTKTQTPSPPIAAGGSITGIAAADDRVWATDLENDVLIEIDSATSSVLRRIPIRAGAVRVAAAGRYVWVTNRERTVTRADATSGRAGTPIEVGLGPIGLAFDGERIWVANSDDGTVSRIDARTGRSVGRELATGRGPVAVAVAGRTVWVANQDDRTLSRFGVDGRPAGDPISVGMVPRGLATDGGWLWVVGTNPSSAVRVDL